MAISLTSISSRGVVGSTARKITGSFVCFKFAEYGSEHLFKSVGLGDYAMKRSYTHRSSYFSVCLATGLLTTLFGGNQIGYAQTNTALGGAFSLQNVSALSSVTSGGNNSAFGANALTALTTASDNTAVGSNAMAANVTGEDNNAFGTSALASLVNGDGNNAFGFNALTNNAPAAATGDQGHDNNAFGNSSLQANRFGQGNTAIGESALRNNLAGNQNVAVGMNSLNNNLADQNVAVGYEALTGNTFGTSNTAIGYRANTAETSSTGTTSVGAASSATEFAATAVGFGAQAEHTASTALGSGATTSRSSQMVLGTTGATYTLPGVGSAASRAAQSGPTQFVTADGDGNLSTDGGATNIIINKNTAGIAGAFAISGIPEVLPNGTRYAVAANWGTFGGANAAALGGVARIDGDLFFNAATVLGYAPGVRAGLAYCW